MKNRRYKTEKYNNKIKNSIDRFNATKKKINKLEDQKNAARMKYREIKIHWIE